MAFVLGGGGLLGAHEVGMLRALLESGVRPDLIVGTSVGAVNGVAIAAEPELTAVERLEHFWTELEDHGLFTGSLVSRLTTLARTKVSLHTHDALRRLVDDHVPARTFDELLIPFQCVAAHVEAAAEHWFTSGPITEAILASCAVPGLLPPVEIDGRTYMDGGMVHSIPVGRAVALGARTLYVLQVGRIEAPLRRPRTPWDVALVSFEIARRHRFAADMASLPSHVTAHLLPTGAEPTRLITQLRYRSHAGIRGRIDAAYAASVDYLSAL